MRNILLKLTFDGSLYHGFQRQVNKNTIQNEIENSIYKLFRSKTDIIGCSRTDKGVHAKEFYANFYTHSSILCENILTGLNTFLPPDIRVLEVKEVREDFHSRFSSKEKEYIYLVYNNKIFDPFLINKAMHFPYDLDMKLLKSYENCFIGEKDFRSFMVASSVVRDTIRTVNSFEITKEEDFVKFKIRGNGFLHNMVRIIVGTILNSQNKNHSSNDILNIIEAKNRKAAGYTVPACGLYLNRVFYKKEDFKNE